MARTEEIETSRLILREITVDDIPLVHDLDSYPEVEQYNTIGIPKDLMATEDVIMPFIDDQVNELRRFYCWKAILKETGEEIGISGLKCSADRFRIGEIWYKLFPSFWGNGYATEIGHTIINYGFQTLKLHRIEAGVDIRNKASIRLVEKLGMTNEGIRRKILPIRGVWCDEFHFSILENDPDSY